MNEIAFYTFIELPVDTTIAVYRDNFPAGMLRIKTRIKDEHSRYLITGDWDTDLRNFIRSADTFHIIEG